MPEEATTLAHIRLARSLPRLLAVPLVVALAGLGAIVAGIVVGPGPVAVVLALLGIVVIAGAATGAGLLLSVRLDVEESAVSLTWWRGRRAFALVPGPVTRVQLRGPRASALRPRSGALGWGIGRARLRNEEDIDLVRLAPTRSAILIPTDRGRLAVAPADEQELLEALATAARARQQVEPEPEPVFEATEVETAFDVEPTALTGIERSLLEERLAREREGTERAAEAERAAAVTPAAAEIPAVTPDRVAPAPARERPALRLVRPPAAWVFVVMPTVAAGLAWGVGRLSGGFPEPGTDLARLTALALVLAGPATSVGAMMALAWWPRLVGLVVAGGLAAVIFIGRSLIG